MIFRIDYNCLQFNVDILPLPYFFVAVICQVISAERSHPILRYFCLKPPGHDSKSDGQFYGDVLGEWG